MSKRNKIRWRTGDEQELQRIIKNFNAKITRVSKKNPESIDILPDRMTMKQAREMIETRKDFNRLTESLRAFSKKGSEKPISLDNNVVTTKWQKKELEKAVKDFNNKVKYHSRVYKGNAPYLPEVKDFTKVIASIEDKKELERVTKSLIDFTKPDSHKLIKSNRGAIFTEWEMKERLAQQERDNEIKRKERAAIEDEEVKIAGVKQGVKKAQMFDVKENSLKESHLDPMNMSSGDWVKFQKRLDARLDTHTRLEKKMQMRENYLKGLRESGFLDSFPKLEQMIREVDIDEFIANVETDDTATFLFYNDPQAYEVRLEGIYNTWKTLYYKTMGWKVEHG